MWGQELANKQHKEWNLCAFKMNIFEVRRWVNMCGITDFTQKFVVVTGF
jgi:hypothetical protein